MLSSRDSVECSQFAGKNELDRVVYVVIVINQAICFNMALTKIMLDSPLFLELQCQNVVAASLITVLALVLRKSLAIPSTQRFRELIAERLSPDAAQLDVGSDMRKMEEVQYKGVGLKNQSAPTS